jgi:hypothetical protein
MTAAPTPLLDIFKRGEATRELKLLAAKGVVAPRALEQIAILILLLDDGDADVRQQAGETLDRIPDEALRPFLARADTPAAIRDFFAARGTLPAAAAASDDDPLVDAGEPIAEPDDDAGGGDPNSRESLTQQLAKMGFTQRLRAAVKGSREMRAVLIRDPNKLISATVLSSPKLTDQEVESFARMANVSEDVLRIIGSNRSWTKNYGVVVGLTKNPKTPLAMSLNFMSRLNDRDLQMLSIDRNVPEPLRVAARKRIVAGTSRG